MNVEMNGLEIAVIGISGRFPGSKSVEEFWQNLINGVELISVFGDDAQKKSANQTIKAGSVLENVELFDADFFGFNPREAEIMDPQHRLFLECAWEALENAGYDSQRVEKAIGVYAGIGMGYYLYHNLLPNQDLIKSIGGLQTLLAVDKDYVPTRVSYKLNLKGPSVSVGTACSSSLVAVHLACQSLLSGECYMALAAGVAVKVPQNELTLSPEGIISNDGHCRAFDASANGTLGGNGIGVVVLKRLEDAIADQDYIYAVIKGSAINNDGAAKIGYTAPSQEGQARVIRAAQLMAEVHPETISYIEAHGTGTPLGDPIEVAAMTQAFRVSTEKKGYCAIGSVKTNVGHLDAAAGITGLIKTVLALHHQKLPPSINFNQPNPQIDFANSPFYVNHQLREWSVNGVPRRAGVSSFGIGGTNAHLILEEASVIVPSSPSRSQQLLLLSAKTPSALQTATTNLAAYLQKYPNLNLADVAYTLQTGRREFDYRRMIVVEDLEDAVKVLESGNTQRIFTQSPETDTPSIVLMFTGQGAQYVNMARDLYENESVFRQECDRCCELLKPHLGIDLRSYLYPPPEETATATQKLLQTAITQPALFVIEYALTKLWMSWGVQPAAMIGHSIGEYVAAYFAGVFSLEDALLLVATRGQLMQQLPPGKMLSVNLSAQQLESYLGDDLALAASNAPNLSVVSGTIAAVEQLEQRLTQEGIEFRRLHTSHAFHSPMMEAIAEAFTQVVQKVKLYSPQIPFISNVTGTWITPTQATDANYWFQHLRQGVRFCEGITELLADHQRIFLEVGPGRTLTTLVKQQTANRIILSSVHHPQEQQSDIGFILHTLGKLWLAGVKVDWSGFYAGEQRRRLPLPSYPFERQRYWIDPPVVNTFDQKREDWFYQPQWKQVNITNQQETAGKRSLSEVEVRQEVGGNLPARTLVFVDQCGLGRQLIKELQQQGKDAIAIEPGSDFTQINQFTYTLNPQNRQNYEALFQTLQTQNQIPTNIIHLWTVTPQGYAESGLTEVKQVQDLGFYSLLFLSQAIGKQKITQKLDLMVISNNMQPVTKTEKLHPEKATILGAVKVIPVEFPHITCRSIDIAIDTLPDHQLVKQLLTELTYPNPEQISAYRGSQRWIQTFERVQLAANSEQIPRLKEKGVYLITGGLGGIGLVLAEYLAKTVKAKLVLTGRSAFPLRVDWEKWLLNHDEADPISRKIRKLGELEALGAEVMTLKADITDLSQMREAIAQAINKFGQFNGIIHAAGVPGGGMIQRKTFEEAERIFAPKVKGTIILDTLFKNTKLDFFVLCSSLVSAIGGLGQIDYVGANAFLDAFAHYKTSTDATFTVAINWDAWQEVGMAAKGRG
ncbi:MAG TPA: type I polyketide synthase, partial [Nostocaceae cyanobacterium]|nr:type I polyketide synthase [Nostocaceae cyanobacterium]